MNLPCLGGGFAYLVRPMNLIEYKTVSAISSKELDNAVNRQLKLGFQPYGSPYVAGTGSHQSIYQALVKHEGAKVHEEAGHSERVPHMFKGAHA